GEQLSPAEVDAAIEQYFARQHRYQEPKAGWGTFWATVWVLRTRLLVAVLLIASLVVGVSMLAHAVTQPTPEPTVVPSLPAPTLASSGRQAVAPTVAPLAKEPIELQFAAFEKLVVLAQQLAASEHARQRVDALASKGKADHARGELAALRATRSDLDRLMARLEEVYVVRIVSRQGERSGVHRIDQTTGNVSGYYLIVEALPE